MNVKNNKKGQAILEYMLLVAFVVMGMIVATNVFNNKVIKPISEWMAASVGKPCSSCDNR